jgi:Arc/MetJ family transcription regulator
MRTNIEIDDQLLQKVRKIRPHATKRAVVEEGLNLLVQLGQQRHLRKFRGRLKWEGDLQAMRSDGPR